MVSLPNFKRSKPLSHEATQHHLSLQCYLKVCEAFEVDFTTAKYDLNHCHIFTK